MMPEPLLRTKLVIPPLRPNLVPRPRLVERLNQGLKLGHRLTLVSAPAGFGKSTLLCYWAQQTELQTRFSWLTLDERDSDLNRFLAYLGGALQTIDHLLGQATTVAFGVAGETNVEKALTRLLNDIAQFPRHVVLILDDYHLMESSSVDRAIAFVLERSPQNMQLVIATRIDPSLHLSRLRASDQMTEIRVDDLRFTTDEAATFLNQVMGMELPAEDAATLGARTEGWIAGLQLAALSMRGSDDASQFVRAFAGSDRFILDYLGEEVLSRQPRNVKDFLLQTSLFDRFTGPLCDAVTGGNDGARMLESLDRDNLFVVPLDNERRWYRYHHLFADLLRARLRRHRAERETGIHLRAVDWFKEQGLMAEAIDHALLANSYVQAASMIEQAAGETISHGHLNTVLRWLDALPQARLVDRPHLRYYQAWALSLSGQSRLAEETVLKARSSLERLPDTPENLSLRGRLSSLLIGIILYSSDPPRIICEAREALTHLPDEELEARARVHIALGTAHAYSDELEKAAETYRLTKELALTAGNPFLATAAIDMLAELELFHFGRLRKTARYLPQIIEMGRTEDGALQSFTGTAHILLAEINLEWNNLKAASDSLERGFELLEEGGIGYSLIHSYCARARLALALGQTDRAVESLQAATQAAREFPLMHMQIHNLAYQVKSALDLGDIETAYRWASGEECDLPQKLPAYLLGVRERALARVSLARGDPNKTLDLLHPVLPHAESANLRAHMIETKLLKALAYQALGENRTAVECLKAALTVASLEGYIRTFVELGRPMARLLNHAAIDGMMADHIDQILAALESAERGDISSPQPLVEPLSQRELQVLQLLAEGLTNREIGERLFLALDTIKGHNRNIYGKLGVRNRAQAVNKAILLEIIEPR